MSAALQRYFIGELRPGQRVMMLVAAVACFTMNLQGWALAAVLLAGVALWQIRK